MTEGTFVVRVTDIEAGPLRLRLPVTRAWLEQALSDTEARPWLAPDGGEDEGRLAVDLSMTPPDGKAIGSVRQEFRFADKGSLRTIDAVITIQADRGVSLTFGDSDDGGFAFRLNESFREDKGARLRNSDGLTGTKEIWANRRCGWTIPPRWKAARRAWRCSTWPPAKSGR